MKKSLIIFPLALLVGLWSGGLFEHYIFNFAFVPDFSVAEARQLNGKKVRETCGRQTEKAKTGKVIGYSQNNYALVGIQITWEDQKADSYTEYSKSSFLRCVEAAE